MNEFKTMTTTTTAPRYCVRCPKEGDGSRVFETEAEAQEYAFSQASKLGVYVTVLDMADGSSWDVYPK